MSQATETKPISFSEAARSCGKTIAIIAPLLVVVLFIVGAIFDNKTVVGEVFHSLCRLVLWTIGLGGHFWGATIVGAFAASALAWAICVGHKVMGECSPQDERRIWVVGCFAFMLWALADYAVVYMISEDANAYQIIAVFVMQFPGLALFIWCMTFLHPGD